MTTIEELRIKINELDESIIKKLSERKQIAIEIGKIKSSQDIDVTDNKREEELMRFYEKLADQHQLQPEFVKKLFTIIIANSRGLQNHLE